MGICLDRRCQIIAPFLVSLISFFSSSILSCPSYLPFFFIIVVLFLSFFFLLPNYHALRTFLFSSFHIIALFLSSFLPFFLSPSILSWPSYRHSFFYFSFISFIFSLQVPPLIASYRPSPSLFLSYPSFSSPFFVLPSITFSSLFLIFFFFLQFLRPPPPPSTHPFFLCSPFIIPTIAIIPSVHRSFWCVTHGRCKQTLLINDVDDSSVVSRYRVGGKGGRDSFGLEIGKSERRRESVW